LRNKPQALLDASPKASVPVLVDSAGQVIDESLDIMLWALKQNDPQAWLRPDQGDLAGMLSLIGECDDDFKFHLDRYKYPQRYEGANREQHRAEAGRWLDGLEFSLARHRFLFGGHMGLADAAIAPFVRQFAHTDLEWFARQPWPHVQTWLLQWSELDLFHRIMEKYPPWEPGAPLTVFPEPSRQ
jgi:glutathione S-transferase